MATLPTTVDSPRFGARDYEGWAAALVESRWLAIASLIGVVAVALVLNVWGLDKQGYGNTYYAAAARSMTLSWSNFFFGALDPGGFITVDKPPVFLWVGALSARIFGYSTLSLLLPSAAAGAGCVALVWLAVRRYFGLAAATIAGLVLALTPIAVAVNRLNLPEPFYILALVGAAFAVLRSSESRRWLAWLALAGLLVGVAFNTKMLAAWIPGPALALAIVAGVQASGKQLLREWAQRLAVFGAVAFVVSLSWLAIVDAWPKDARPYIGGSKDNSVEDLVLGYNGLGRVEGENQGVGGGARPGGNSQPPSNQQRGGFPGGTIPGGGAPNANTNRGGFQGPGGIVAGRPGLFRMFDPANGGQIAWFLPFALLGGVLSLWYWRADPVRRSAVVLGLGWVLFFGVVFSYTKGIYHSYYTSAMAPGVALLVGASVVAVVALARRNALWLVAGIGIVAVTLWTQLIIAGRVDGFFEDMRPIATLIVAAGCGLLGIAAARRIPSMVGLAVAIAGLLLLPAAWSTYETAHASLNATLPQAGPRQGAAGRTFGSDAFDNANSQLAAWLVAHDTGTQRWDLVVSSAQTASTLIAANKLSVMALGGFLGSDPTITAARFAELAKDGEVRYVLTTGGMGGGGPAGGGRLPNLPTTRGGGATPNRTPTTAPVPDSTQAGASAVLAYVTSACTAVTDTSLPASYRGSLYDCGNLAR